MKCEICGKEILRDSQCINYKYYHNDCIEKLQQENKQLREIIKENTILVKDEYGDYQECNINPLGMKQKYEKQVDNWNKLKEFIDTLWLDNKGIVTKIKDKIELIEQGDSNVKEKED